jgi:transcriptional regulator with XRE-family HTH domain
MPNLNDGAVELARLMGARAMTAAAVLRVAQAKGLPLSQAMLSGILGGKKRIGLDSARTLAAVFDVPAATFLPELAEFAPPATADEPGS